MEKDGFNQEKYNQLFDSIPNAATDSEGLAVLRVWVFGLSCGGVAIAIANHHTLGDAMAASDIATNIGKACADPDYEPVVLWTSRDQICGMLMASLKGDEIVDDSYVRHLYQLAPTASTADLQNVDQMIPYQFSLKEDSLRRLKELAILDGKDGEACSMNDMVGALFWRAHTRALVSHGSTSEYTYTCVPKDLRHFIGATNYLGNLIVMCPVFATKSFVLDSGLASVARLINRCTQNGSAAGLLLSIEALESGALDMVPSLAVNDSPAAAFSNMSRLPLRQVDFGLGKLGSVQLRSYSCPYFVHTIDDGANGFLANICMPTRMLSAYTSNEELMSYIDIVY